jgi:predicted N-acetyltransferase YhbS
MIFAGVSRPDGSQFLHVMPDPAVDVAYQKQGIGQRLLRDASGGRLEYDADIVVGRESPDVISGTSA